MQDDNENDKGRVEGIQKRDVDIADIIQNPN
jgi:hypothetical protein